MKEEQALDLDLLTWACR